jgi:hypothetical protein
MPAPAETIEESPRLEQKTGPRKHIVLRCLIYEEDSSSFVGECIDLDLMVKAKTPEAAMKSLEGALIGYLKPVADVGDESPIHRPSPLRRRIQRRRSRTDTTNFVFSTGLPAPAQPLAESRV